MRQKNNAGFTLVEMAVVLVIIGLIATAILSGQAIIAAAETRSVMAEIREHMQSFNTFTERYRTYPGDMRNADEVFEQDIEAAVAAANNPFDLGITAGSYNGDGNNRVEWSKEEGAKAWFHMQIAGLTDGSYSGLGTGAVIRANIPASNVGGGGNGYYINYNNVMQNHLGLGGQQDSGINNRSSLSPERAESIDRKLDDGKPALGFIRAVNGFPNPPVDCINSLNGYNLGDFTGPVIACVLMIKLN